MEAGTSLEQILLDLGSTINATLNDETETSVTLNIEWTAPEGFDPAKPGSYTFVGTLSTDEGVEFTIPAKLGTVEVTVEVGAVDVTDSIETVSFATTSTIEVELSSPIIGATKGSFKVVLGEDANTVEEDLVTLELLSVDANDDNNVYTLTIADLAGTEGYITVNGIVLGAFDFTAEAVTALVNDIKSKADAGMPVEANLSAPALKLTEVRDGVNYLDAIKGAFVVKTVEDLQAIITAVNAELDGEVAEKLEAVKEANTTSKLKVALGAVTGLENVVYNLTRNDTDEIVSDNGFLPEYHTAIANSTFDKVEELQAIIDAANDAKVAGLVEAAESVKTVQAVEAAQDAINDVAAAGDTDFDKPAEGEELGAYVARLAAVTNAINKAAVDKAINALKPTIAAKQIAETDSEQSVLEINVEYPEVEADVSAASEYTVDSVITVPATFAGATLEFDLVGNEGGISYKVPAAEEGATTISFSLLEVINSGVHEGQEIEPHTLVSQEGLKFTVEVDVPYGSTTLATGNYTIKLQAVATAGTGEEADVRVLTTKSVSVKIIANPDIPEAIAAVLDATIAGEEANDENNSESTGLIKALEELKELDSTFEFTASNAAEYLKAFNKYTSAQDEAATIETIQATIDTVDAQVALEAAISALEAVDSNVLTLLQKEEFGYDVENTTHTVLTVFEKNAVLYEAAIEEAVTANKTDKPTFATVEEVKAVLDAVNASDLGKLNAAISASEFKTALIAVEGIDLELYNELTSAQQTALVSYFLKIGEGISTLEMLQKSVDMFAMQIILGDNLNSNQP